MMDFIEAIKKGVEIFKKTKGPVRIVSHFDCDGISSAAILSKAMCNEDRAFNLSIVKNLTEDVLKEVSLEKYKVVIFSDLGSGSLEEINKHLRNKDVFILDHHLFKKVKLEENVHFLNPLVYGRKENEISGAGISYLFAKYLNEKNKEVAHIALVGAIGDIQEGGGFTGLNKVILEDAKEKIEIKRGLRMFGLQTRPIHKVLEYSTDPFIPGITGDEGAAIAFLKDLGIPLRDSNGTRKLIHLTTEEMKRLTTAIILRRMGTEKNPDKDVIGDIYLLKDEEDGSPIKDMREFSTLLNACGRLGKPSLGVGVCLGCQKSKEGAFKLLREYKQEIINSLNWFYANRESDLVYEGDGYVIINSEENIRDTLIGTVASIISKSNIYKDGTIVLSMANRVDDTSKVSIRIAGYKNDVDLKSILEKISKGLSVEIGGHAFAAGAIVMQDDVPKFIENAKKVLEKVVK
jgi:RecJ-like exonuclease